MIPSVTLALSSLQEVHPSHSECGAGERCTNTPSKWWVHFPTCCIAALVTWKHATVTVFQLCPQALWFREQGKVIRVSSAKRKKLWSGLWCGLDMRHYFGLRLELCYLCFNSHTWPFSNSVTPLSVSQADPLSQVCSKLASELKAQSDQVLLSHRNATVKPTESPVSLKLTTADIMGKQASTHPTSIR